MVRAMVMRGARREKPISISFFGFRERCQYLHVVVVRR